MLVSAQGRGRHNAGMFFDVSAAGQGHLGAGWVSARCATPARPFGGAARALLFCGQSSIAVKCAAQTSSRSWAMTSMAASHSAEAASLVASLSSSGK
jgi:hypothetical protein